MTGRQGLCVFYSYEQPLPRIYRGIPQNLSFEVNLLTHLVLRNLTSHVVVSGEFVIVRMCKTSRHGNPASQPITCMIATIPESHRRREKRREKPLAIVSLADQAHGCRDAIAFAVRAIAGYLKDVTDSQGYGYWYSAGNLTDSTRGKRIACLSEG